MNLKEKIKIPKEISKKTRKNRRSTVRHEKFKGKTSKILNALRELVRNNLKEYIVITLIFLIGIFLGVMFVNNLEEEPKNEIISYIKTYLEAFEQSDSTNNIMLLKNNIKDNIILTILIWFIGSTIIRNTNSIWNNCI